MKNDESEKIIIQKSKSLYDALISLSLNPEDKQATTKLVKLVDEISFGK